MFGSNIKISNKNKLFFIDSIISIEAKIKNWKQAFNQANINTLFSSESYVLFPDKLTVINNGTVDSYFNDIGIFTYNGSDNINILRKARKVQIPTSYLSWVFNENIGRSLFNEKYR